MVSAPRHGRNPTQRFVGVSLAHRPESESPAREPCRLLFSLMANSLAIRPRYYSRRSEMGRRSRGIGREV